MQLPSGRPCVVVDRQEEIAKINLKDPHSLYEYLMAHVGDELNAQFFIGRDLPGEYVYSQTSRGYNARTAKAKAKLATSLDEAVTASGKITVEPAKHKRREGGVYYKAPFAFAVRAGFGNDFAGYTANILFYTENGDKLLYDVVEIKDAPDIGADVAKISPTRTTNTGASRDMPVVSGATSSSIPHSPDLAQGGSRLSLATPGADDLGDPFANSSKQPVDFLLAHRIFAANGKPPSREETLRLLKAYGSSEAPRDVLARAISLSQDINAYLEKIGQNPDVVRAVAAAGLALEAKGAQTRARNALMSFDAKAADVEAAAVLIEKVVKPEKVRELVAAHPNASIVVPVYAEEATGRNQLPRKFADYISALTGIEADSEITQTVRANHTGSTADHRLFIQPEFDGEVRRGREYIIVDDHITQGGTVNALRDHIESNGGKVVAIAALTLSQGSSILSPQKDTIDEVKRKWPDINRLLRAAGIADRAEALTESQLRYILKFSPDAFRNRIAQAVEQGVARTQYETLGTPSEGVAREETEAERARMRHSVFVGNRAILRRVVDLSTRGQARSILDNRHNGHYTSEARDEIYLKTGWWLGTDGKWRFELSDLKPKKRGKTVGGIWYNPRQHEGDK